MEKDRLSQSDILSDLVSLASDDDEFYTDTLELPTIERRRRNTPCFTGNALDSSVPFPPVSATSLARKPHTGGGGLSPFLPIPPSPRTRSLRSFSPAFSRHGQASKPSFLERDWTKKPYYHQSLLQDNPRAPTHTRHFFGPYLYPPTSRKGFYRDLPFSSLSADEKDREAEEELTDTRKPRLHSLAEEDVALSGRGDDETPRSSAEREEARKEDWVVVNHPHNVLLKKKDAKTLSPVEIRNFWRSRSPTECPVVEQRRIAQEEEEHAEDKLPVFGTRPSHRRRLLMKQIRPVPLFEWPLHEFGCPLPSHLEKNFSFRSTPNEDEVRRLGKYPDEMERRRAEDHAVFTVGRHLFLRQYAKAKVKALRQKAERMGLQRDHYIKRLLAVAKGRRTADEDDDEEQEEEEDDDKKEESMDEEDILEHIAKLSISRLKTKKSPMGDLADEPILLSGRTWRWDLWDRDRWQRTSLLRKLMKRGKVLFQSDWEEREYAIDYERFFKKPFVPPRLDWGGYDYYQNMTELEKEENKNLVAELVNSEIQELEELERARREEEMATAKAEKERLKQQRLSQDKIIKFLEMSDGYLPMAFEGASRSRKKRHPKNCVVPSCRLKQYGATVDDLTRCPFLQMDMEQGLCRGWREKGGRGRLVKHVAPPRGIPKDKYTLTRAALEKAAEKLKVPLQEDPTISLSVKPKRVERAAEPEKKLGGGRYAV